MANDGCEGNSVLVRGEQDESLVSGNRGDEFTASEGEFLAGYAVAQRCVQRVAATIPGYDDAY